MLWQQVVAAEVVRQPDVAVVVALGLELMMVAVTSDAFRVIRLALKAMPMVVWR